MEVELLGPSPTPLERLSVERVVACWLQLQYADTASAAPAETIAQQKFWAQRQDQAHRRYQASVRQLLAIRQAIPKSSQTEAESGTSSADSATDASPESTGVTHADPDTTPRPAASNGNGRVNGSRFGNGEAPESDEPVQTNGHPVNRIHQLSKTTALPSVSD